MPGQKNRNPCAVRIPLALPTLFILPSVKNGAYKAYKKRLFASQIVDKVQGESLGYCRIDEAKSQ